MPDTMEWRGTTDGDFAKAANWIDSATGVAPASSPANGDTIKFNKGNVDVDAGLTTSRTGMIIVGTSGYTGRIGPASPLSIASASVRWLGCGSLNITGNITAGRIRCRTGSSFTYAGGTATSLYIERTDYSIAAAAVVTTARTYQSFGSDLNNGTGFTLFDCVGGMHTSRRAGKFVMSAQSKLKAKIGCDLTAGTQIVGRSKVEYLSQEDIAADVTVYPDGYFDGSGSDGFAWSGTLNRWPGASINLDSGGGAVVPSTINTYGIGDNVGDAIPVP